MDFLKRLFGRDSTSEERTTTNSERDVVIDLSGDEVSVEGAEYSSDVRVSSADPSGLVTRLSDGTWFAAHDFDSEGRIPSSESAVSKGESDRSQTVDGPGADLKSEAKSSPSSYHNAVQLPGDPAVLQALEIRAKNGAQSRVETLYFLTADSLGPVRDLWALDDPKLYEVATSERLVTYSRRVANRIANQMSAPPQQVVRVHTHPPTAGDTTRPSTSPSKTDTKTAGRVTEHFADAFDVAPDTVNFIQGIHAYTEIRDPAATEAVRQAEVIDNGISWIGEQYRHTLALYDESFRNEREVELVQKSSEYPGK